MPLMKSASGKGVSHNIKEMVRSGHPQKQAIAAALANQRKYKKMAKGGMVQSIDEGGMGDVPKESMGMVGPSENSEAMSMVKKVPSGGLAKNESMYEMDDLGVESDKRDLNELRADGEYYPAEIENPVEMDEAQGFAHALRRKAMQAMSPENYAMGGLVQDGPEEDEMLNGNHPEGIEDSPEMAEMIGAEPGKPEMKEPSGIELSDEAKEALKRKRASRRYGMYDPKSI